METLSMARSFFAEANAALRLRQKSANESYDSERLVR
jgi:hypothetical protein